MICQGPHCGQEIRFAKIDDVTRPVNWPAEVVVLADGRKATAWVLHTSVCRDVAMDTRSQKKVAAGKEAHHE